jgi:hypothetical protein
LATSNLEKSILVKSILGFLFIVSEPFFILDPPHAASN